MRNDRDAPPAGQPGNGAARRIIGLPAIGQPPAGADPDLAIGALHQMGGATQKPRGPAPLRTDPGQKHRDGTQRRATMLGQVFPGVYDPRLILHDSGDPFPVQIGTQGGSRINRGAPGAGLGAVALPGGFQESCQIPGRGHRRGRRTFPACLVPGNDGAKCLPRAFGAKRPPAARRRSLRGAGHGQGRLVELGQGQAGGRDTAALKAGKTFRSRPPGLEQGAMVPAIGLPMPQPSPGRGRSNRSRTTV